MGLDMYLYRRHYVKRWDWEEPKRQFKVTVERGDQPYEAIKPERVCFVTEEIGQWRKANAIHKWFVDNVQEGVDNCGEYYVSPDQLRELLDAVNRAMTAANPGEVLPTQPGFFFGPTDYDDWYHADLEDTKKIIEDALVDPDTGSFYYHSSW